MHGSLVQSVCQFYRKLGLRELRSKIIEGKSVAFGVDGSE